MGLIGALGILFVGLKLAGVIAWSWWLVLIPLYVYAAPAALFLLALVAALASGMKLTIRRKS